MAVGANNKSIAGAAGPFTASGYELADASIAGGVVIFDPTTGLAVDPTAIVPVRIDQTTHGTTNRVSAALEAGSNLVGKVNLAQDEYETVAASQTAQALGATGGTGDYIAGLLVIPATTSPGNVLLLDNATSITVFVGGASSVSNLVPFFIPLGIKSVSGAWKVTTGASVSVIGIGDFT